MGGGETYPLASKGPARDNPETFASPAKTPEINVLITGFGPFPRGDGGQYTRNASHLITRQLPGILRPSSHLNTSGLHVNIINPTAGDGAYIPTEYAEIRKHTKALHAEYASKVDLFLHLGQADGWHHIAVERLAYKEGMSSTWWSHQEEEKYYKSKDNAGRNIDHLGPCPWEGVPMGLHTALNVDEIVPRANKALRKNYKHSKEVAGVLSPELSDDNNDDEEHEDDAVGSAKHKKHEKHAKPLEVVPHHEPGSYGCGFIFYESMANCFVQMRRRDVLFCHVPGETDDQSIENGRDAILAVIGAAAHQIAKRKAAEGEISEAK